MRNINLRLVLGLLAVQALSVPGALPAQDLRHDFELEAGLLDAEIAAYADVRVHERAALDALQSLNRRLDDTLADPNAAPVELLGLETEIAVARDRAFAASRESADRRAAMYDRMRRLGSLAREFASLEGGGGGVGGFWRVEAQSGELWGLLELTQEGSLVSGSYRFSNGARGSARGTYAGTRLDLELVDSQRGPVGTIWGEVDSRSTEIRGSWQARQLGTGRPSGGHWSAERVSLEEARGLNP